MGNLLHPLLGDGSAVVPADQSGQSALVHQLHVVADPPFAEGHPVILHPPRDDTRPYRPRGVLQDPQDEEDFLLDILQVENLIHRHR